MEERFEQILESHGIYGEDLDDIVYAMNEILLEAVKDTKENEPYARNTIAMYETAARAMSELRLYWV